MPMAQSPENKEMYRENIVLQAVMDEHEPNRKEGNLTAEILDKEKVIMKFQIVNNHTSPY